MLEVRSLMFDYQDKPLLNNINFNLSVNQLLHLQGKNGSGKTTLLKLLSGILQPQAGAIFYQGKNVREHLSAYQQNICYLGHKAGINPTLTLRENCWFDMHWPGHLDFSQWLSGFGLQGLENQPCYLLSAGQKRRVALLRLAMTKAKLWLLDEPLVALDAQAVETLMAVLTAHLERGGQVIVTSHQTLPLPVSYQELFL